MSLEVTIAKRFEGFTLHADFAAGNTAAAILGASGCGKSMTLGCIAGIVKPDKGHIELNGRVLFDSEKKIDLPPQKRKVGCLFQQYALFPHMTVEQNIRAGAHARLLRHRRAGQLLRLRILHCRLSYAARAVRRAGADGRRPDYN